MPTRVIQTESEARSLCDYWDRLAHGNMFCRFDWLMDWWKFFGRGNQLMIIVVEDDSHNILGIAPFYRGHTSRLGKTIRFLGSNSVCSDYLKILAEPQNQHQVGTEVALQLVQAMQDPSLAWDVIELAGATADELTVNLLCRELAQHQYSVHESALDSCWKIELPDSWGSFKLRLGKSFRRALTKLERELVLTGRAKLLMANEDTFDTAWQTLVRLHQKRRDSLGDKGCFSDQRFEGFLKQTARKALKEDRLILQWTELDAIPIGASIGMIEGDDLKMYQTGIEPEFVKYRPGHLHNSLVIQDAFKRGIKTFDFLRGNESYKRLWRAEPTSLNLVHILSDRLMTQLRHKAWMTGRVVKDWIKSSHVE